MAPGDLLVVAARDGHKPSWAWDDEGTSHWLDDGKLVIMLSIEEEERVDPSFTICRILVDGKLLEMNIIDLQEAPNE